jgi:hypothetical protein
VIDRAPRRAVRLWSWRYSMPTMAIAVGTPTSAQTVLVMTWCMNRFVPAGLSVDRWQRRSPRRSLDGRLRNHDGSTGRRHVHIHPDEPNHAW